MAGFAGLAAGERAGLPDFSRSSADHGGEAIPFWGEHQAGVGTAPQSSLHFAAFELTTRGRQDVIDLMRAWSLAGSRMCRAEAAAAPADDALSPADTGEARGLSAARLTITFGFGTGLFESGGNDRYGLADRRPAALADLPAFATDNLDPARSGGDLAVQACSDDPQVAFHAIRNLARIARDVATLRWSQSGFGGATPGGAMQARRRNLLGFKDGANNIRADNDGLMDDHVWVGAEGPAWMLGGSYLVARKIRMRIAQWDRDSARDQGARIGREKISGAPLGGVHELDAVDLDTKVNGRAVVPEDAHIRLASPLSNDGARILRRSYSFADGVDASGGLDAGLFFISYQRDPRRQFVPIQQRLAEHDALNHYITHTGSAVFACPGGMAPGEWIGQGLFES